MAAVLPELEQAATEHKHLLDPRAALHTSARPRQNIDDLVKSVPARDINQVECLLKDFKPLVVQMCNEAIILLNIGLKHQAFPSTCQNTIRSTAVAARQDYVAVENTVASALRTIAGFPAAHPVCGIAKPDQAINMLLAAKHLSATSPTSTFFSLAE